MALTVEDKQRIANHMMKTVGCPMTVSDGLSGFRAGVEATLNTLSPMVTLDKTTAPINGTVSRLPKEEEVKN